MMALDFFSSSSSDSAAFGGSQGVRWLLASQHPAPGPDPP